MIKYLRYESLAAKICFGTSVANELSTNIYNHNQ